MRKMTAMMAMMCVTVMLTAGFAVAADDISIDNSNGFTGTQNVTANPNATSTVSGVSSNATGGAATIDRSGNSTINGSGNSRNSGNATIRGNLLQVGFGSFLNSGTSLDSSEWAIFYPCIYRVLTIEKIESMRPKFRVSDLWPGNWDDQMEYTPVGKSLPKNSDPIYLMTYWPKAMMNSGDESLGSILLYNRPGMTEEALLGKAASVCKDKTQTRRIAVRGRIKKDGVTIGKSIGGSGAVSGLSSAGDSGVAFTAGGMFGKNRTKMEDYQEFDVLCMNDGPSDLSNQTLYCEAQKHPVVQSLPAPQPPAACNPDEIFLRISELKLEVQKCTRYCYNNLTLRNALGDAYIDLYVCTGDRKYLKDAAYHYQVAERNFRNGHDISAHKAEAGQIIAQVYYNWAGVIYNLEGRERAMKFAKAKRLERIPFGFTR